MRNSLVVLLILLAIKAFSYPIEPTPLRILTLEADCIVYGTVIAVSDSETEWATATLLVEEQLKGTQTMDTIVISVLTGIMCPAPAHYEANKKYLAFLTQDADGFSTYALSYGAKALNQKEFDVYKSRITELHAIFKLKSQRMRDKSLGDWLIRCCKDTLTLWEGAFDLLHAAKYEEEKHRIRIRYTRSIKSELRALLERGKEVQYHYILLCDVVEQFDPKQALEWLKHQVLELDYHPLTIADHLLPRIADISTRMEIKDLANTLRTQYFESEAESAHLLARIKLEIEQLTVPD